MPFVPALSQSATLRRLGPVKAREGRQKTAPSSLVRLGSSFYIFRRSFFIHARPFALREPFDGPSRAFAQPLPATTALRGSLQQPFLRGFPFEANREVIWLSGFFRADRKVSSEMSDGPSPVSRPFPASFDAIPVLLPLASQTHQLVGEGSEKTDSTAVVYCLAEAFAPSLLKFSVESARWGGSDGRSSCLSPFSFQDILFFAHNTTRVAEANMTAKATTGWLHLASTTLWNLAAKHPVASSTTNPHQNPAQLSRCFFSFLHSQFVSSCDRLKNGGQNSALRTGREKEKKGGKCERFSHWSLGSLLSLV